MTLINRTQIYDPSAPSAINIPPFDLKFEASEIVDYQDAVVPRAAYGNPATVALVNRRVGHKLTLSGLYPGSSVADGLVWRQTLREWFRPSGVTRTFELCHWTDSDSVYNGTYRNCEIQALTDPMKDVNTERNQRFTLEIISRNAQVFGRYSDGSAPSAGPWEALLFSGSAMDATPPTGTIEVSKGHRFHGVFGGEIDAATTADNTATLQHIWRPPAACTIRNFQVGSAQPSPFTSGPSAQGTTSLRVSKRAWDGGGSDLLNLSIGATAMRVAPVAGSFTVAEGEDVYVFVTAAGHHQFVQYAFDAETE